MALIHGLLLAAGLAAASPSLEQAQKIYDAGDYVQAAAAFEALAHASPEDPALSYDLGNALFKAGKTGRAIAAYQRAYELAPRDPDIRQNLDFALRKVGEELVPPGLPPLLHHLFHLLSGAELAGLHWLACWAVFILGGLCLLRPAFREALLTPACVALAVWVALASWWGARLAAQPKARGVIITASAELRSGPGDNFSVGFTAPEGRRLQILSQRPGWLEVGVLKEGAMGWIAESAVEKL